MRQYQSTGDCPHPLWGPQQMAHSPYPSHSTTSNSRRAIDLDPTTVQVLSAWKAWQAAERAATRI
jgi:hypothetical protein